MLSLVVVPFTGSPLARKRRIARQQLMGSLLGDLPSFDPQNFSQISVFDPLKPTRTPATYQPTHDRTLPPPDQVISSESKNILIRHFYQPSHEKLRLKRAANESLAPEHETKHPRAHDPSPLD